MGSIRRARGLRGEVVVDPAGSRAERFQPGLSVILARGEAMQPGEIESSWMHGDQLVVKFDGVNDRTGAEALKGMEIRIPLEERPPAPEGEYYLSDLVGCRMESVDGRTIGDVKGYFEFGAAPLLEVDRDGRELLVPFAEGIYRRVDLENRLIVVELPEGLEDL